MPYVATYLLCLLLLTACFGPYTVYCRSHRNKVDLNLQLSIVSVAWESTICLVRKSLQFSAEPQLASKWPLCKNGEGRAGRFYYMNDVSVYLGRQRRRSGHKLQQVVLSSLFSIRTLYLGLTSFM